MIRCRLLWIIVLPVGLVALAISCRDYARAKHAAEHELKRAHTLTSHLRDLEQFRPVADSWRERKRPTAGLAALLGETLSNCGIPTAVLSNVTPQPEISVQGPPGTESLKRQRAGFTLTPITLPQLGAFLHAWRSREPYWIVASIDVSPEPIRRHDDSMAGRDLPLRAVLVLDAVYLDEPKEDRK